MCVLCNLQKLWATLAANRLNIVPSLNFLIDRGLKEDAAGVDAGAAAATGKEVGWQRGCATAIKCEAFCWRFCRAVKQDDLH